MYCINYVVQCSCSLLLLLLFNYHWSSRQCTCCCCCSCTCCCWCTVSRVGAEFWAKKNKAYAKATVQTTGRNGSFVFSICTWERRGEVVLDICCCCCVIYNSSTDYDYELYIYCFFFYWQTNIVCVFIVSICRSVKAKSIEQTV